MVGVKFKTQAHILPVQPDNLPSLRFCFLVVMTATLFLLTGGPIHVSFPSGLTLEEVQRKNPLVVRGGRYRPPSCEARHRTAIIIPHRHREHHLKFLLYYLHPFLQRQQLQYGIYVIHQVKHAQPSQTSPQRVRLRLVHQAGSGARSEPDLVPVLSFFNHLSTSSWF